MPETHPTARLTRRRLLLVLGGSAASMGLLAVSGTGSAEISPREHHTLLNEAVAAVLAPAALAAAPAAAEPLAPFRQSTLAGFMPIDSTLTFGAAADLASGWDGTLWAIDSAGAPHQYDPLSGTWQLHGRGIDAAALIQDVGPAVYFQGPEMFIADGQHAAQAISTAWPDLPPSYQLGVQGAAWVNGKVMLFRGGTYLTAPWPPPGGFAQTTPSETPAATDMHAPEASSGDVYHAALLSAATALPTAAQSASRTPTPAASATPTAAGRTATATPPAGTPTPAAATASPTPASTPSPAPSSPTPATPSPGTTATPAATGTGTPAATPAATQTPPPASAAQADYVAAPLAALVGWPESADWQDGTIDGVFSFGNSMVSLLRGGETIAVQFQSQGAPSSSAPHALSTVSDFAQLPADWQANGFDAGFRARGGPMSGYDFITSGAQAMVFPAPASSSATRQAGTPAATPTATISASDRDLAARLRGSPALHYVADIASGWPTYWHPTFKHAPNGRTSSLWGATVEGHVVSFDGTRWTPQPGDATSVSAGVDGAVFGVGQTKPQQLSQWTGSRWNLIASHSSPLTQVAVGNQASVWVRDSGNAVHQLTGSQLQPAPLVGSAAHLAANYDGTLWSCNGNDSNTFRLASDLNVAPAAVPAAGTVQKVASTGFGAAHCLSDQNGTAQVYRYDSPFVFRTPGSYELGSDRPHRARPWQPVLRYADRIPRRRPQLPGGCARQPYRSGALTLHDGGDRVALHGAGIRSHPRNRHRRPDARLSDAFAARHADRSGRSRPDERALDDCAAQQPGARPRPTDAAGHAAVRFRQLQHAAHVRHRTGAWRHAQFDPAWTFTLPSASQDRHQLPPPVLANGERVCRLVVVVDVVRVPAGLALEARCGHRHRSADGAAFHLSGLRPDDQPRSLGADRPVPASAGHAAWRRSRGNPARCCSSTVARSSGASTSMRSPPSPIACRGRSQRLESVISGFAFDNGVLWFGDSTARCTDSMISSRVSNTPAPLKASDDSARARTSRPNRCSTTTARARRQCWSACCLPPSPGLLVFDPDSAATSPRCPHKERPSAR